MRSHTDSFGPALLALALLAACGGSGGSAGSGGNASLSIDVSALRFVGLRGVPLPSQTIHVTATGSGTYYPGVRATPPGLWEYSYAITGATTASVHIRPAAAVSPSTMPVGVGTGSISFLACHDAACNSVAASATATLEVDVAAVPGAAIRITTFEGLPGAAVDLAVAPAGAGPTLTVSSDAAGPSTDPVPWLGIERDPSSVVRTRGLGAGLVAGEYFGELHVSRSGMSGGLDIPVTLAVSSGTVPPAPRRLTVDLATRAGALAGTIPVGFQAGLAPAWTVETDQHWLRVTGPGSAGPGDLGYAIDAAALADLANWSSSTATITIRPAGMAPATTTFTVDKQLPEVRFAATPLVAGRATDVRVFGRGFSQLGSAADLAVQGLGASSGTIASDIEARLDGVTLGAGRHSVSVVNPLGIPTRTAPIDVYVPNATPAGSADDVGAIRTVAFDLAREQILVSKQGRIVRLRLVAGAWQLDSTDLPNLADLVLAPDGATVYASTGTLANTLERFPLHALDPATLAIRASYLPTGSISGITSYSSANRGPVFTADGRLWLPAGSWSGAVYFDPSTGAFVEHRATPADSLSFMGPVFAAPADGSRLLALTSTAVWNNAVYSDRRPWSYTPAGNAFVHDAAAPWLSSAGFSADGGRLLASSAVYDGATWALLGNAVLSSPSVGGPSALSPDGRRIYRAAHEAFAGQPSNGTVTRIEVFDADALSAGTTDFVRLGEIAVTAQVAACGIYYSNAADCAAQARLYVSPLGDALLLGGSKKLVVVPIPAALSGVVSP